MRMTRPGQPSILYAVSKSYDFNAPEDYHLGPVR